MSTKEITDAMPMIGDLVENLEDQGFGPTEIADALVAAGITLGSEVMGFTRTAMILGRLAENCEQHGLSIGESGPRH